MARKYRNEPDLLVFDSKKDPERWLRIEQVGKRLAVDKFNPPPLTRKNATDLRDWLTAWLERTK